jgi:hypothetical protein
MVVQGACFFVPLIMIGLSNEEEKQYVSEGLINKSTQYINVGQLTSAYRNRGKLNRWEIGDREYSCGVCVYPTSISDYRMPHTASDFFDFIDTICASFMNENVMVFFKSKQDVKKQRGDPIETLMLKYDRIAIERMNEGLGENFRALDEGVTVYDTFDNIDIGLVFSMSTVAFELLQNKKKVLVYWPSSGTDIHPFALHTPLLVAFSKNDLIEKLKKIKEMSDLEYEKYILPTLQYCLGGSDSSSIGQFIEQIENN